ncbi:MAG TPA: M14 family zinc carboxypeptidase [Gemmatimonadales bacterium]|nr:M14 family zinc carboxypeptidase [Gemmatimonadales bacterium]
MRTHTRLLITLPLLPLLPLLPQRLCAQQGPLTTAERTNYQQTSSTADVSAFLDSLQARGAPIAVSSMGTSVLGKPILFVIASDPRVTSPEEAKRSGKVVVYIQANIHAGEVEGKEAVQELLRELMGPHHDLLDKLVLLVAPVYNPDGNDAFGPQERHRSEQNGPELVGLRPDGWNLDLNRDYLKAEAPETRASLTHVYDTWDPAVMMDLHTTDGTLHGYLLTYSPPLDPNGPPGPTDFVRDSLLPSVRHTLATKYHEPIFDYGNVADRMHPKAWTTYAPLAWYGTNYVGVRGRMAILSEAYSHADFKTRIKVTHDFVLEILEYVAAHADQIQAIERAADRQTTLEGRGTLPRPDLAVNYKPASRGVEPVTLEIMRPTGDTVRGEPVLEGTGKTHVVDLPIYDRFVASDSVALPAGYFLPPSETDVVALLRRHGIAVERLSAPWRDSVQVLHPSSPTWSKQEFQGHFLLAVKGDWTTVVRTENAGTFFVSTGQPLGRLVFTLLEPEGWGLARWGFFDKLLGSEYGTLSGLTYGSQAVAEFPLQRALRAPVVATREVR